MAADPNSAERLLACSIIDAPLDPGAAKDRTVAYVSFDNGVTWNLGAKSNLAGGGDPSCEYGPEGAAYFLSISTTHWDTLGAWTAELHRSADGGHTWSAPLLSKGGDRPWLAVDRVRGGSMGTLYVAYHAGIAGLHPDTRPTVIGLQLKRSTDGGATWSEPAVRLQNGSAFPGEPAPATPAQAVVLSDGTVVILFLGRDSFPGPAPARVGFATREWAYYVTTSVDSGRTLTQSTKLANYVQFYGTPGTPGTIATLAVDPGPRSPFHDRLYAAWLDARSGRSEIYFSYSVDKGRTWTRPRVVSDDRAWPSPRVGPDNEMPTVAVNADGVVALMWYDRRDNADNIGFYPRIRASLDGGDTWLPSVRLTDQPNRFIGPDPTQISIESFRSPDATDDRHPPSEGTPSPSTIEVRNSLWFTNGHTAGLAADARGSFHALWVDNRTGIKQVYTAPVTVAGDVLPNGSRALAKFTDVTTRVAVDLETLSGTYDSATRSVTIHARLRNMSHDTLPGSLVLRAVTLTSELGVVRSMNADNHVATEGAAWWFAPVTGDVLPPGGATIDRPLVFRLAEPRQMNDGDRIKLGLVKLEVRILKQPFATSH